MIETRLIPAIEPGAYETARAIITSGGLVCFPTDTVYGLAAGIHSEAGIRRLYTAKGRKSKQGHPGVGRQPRAGPVSHIPLAPGSQPPG